MRTSKHFACGCCMGEQSKGKAHESVIIRLLRDTALLLWIRQQAQARSSCSRLRNVLVETLAQPQPPLSMLHIPLGPTSLLDSFQGKLKRSENLICQWGFNGHIFLQSSDGYVQSPFSTCVTTTRAVGAP